MPYMADFRADSWAAAHGTSAWKYDGLPAQRGDGRDVSIEALPALEWSVAIEAVGGSDISSPAQARRAPVHRAPIQSVLRLYRQARAAAGDVPAPWWLRALDIGALDSREAGF